MFASGARGVRFKSRVGQIGQSVPTARHFCNISSKGNMLLGHNDAEMGPVNFLHASA